MDHLPPWLSLGAVAATEIYEPAELAMMATPLLAGALVEWRGWQLAPRRRLLEALVLVALAGLVWARLGLVPTTIVMLFILSGFRLSLPREAPHQRQLLLMGFLIWITTAIATFELPFLLWSLLWLFGAALVLMQHAWESSARLRGGLLQQPPYGRLPGWVLSTVVLSAVFFVSLPRITLGLRAFPWGVAGLTAAQAGLSDVLDLGDKGAIAPNDEVVLRLMPPAGISAAERGRYGERVALLKGITLETVEGQTWSHTHDTPATPFVRLDPTLFPMPAPPPGRLLLDCLLAPSPRGILPLPYGELNLLPPPGMPIFAGPGGSLRWLYPSRRPIPLQILIDADATAMERRPTRSRIRQLLQAGTGTESAARWSRREVPEELPPAELAERLTRKLQTFAYTVSNPSGNAANPLADFLERTRAGHCEYFASALALMLRHRGVPARVVNGYRRGPWIAEGGYWLVTQNEAHSWVEYFDEPAGLWRLADPTPAAPAGELEGQTVWAAFQRWADAIRFRWDRHVVRFSDEDQVAGINWAQSQLSSLGDLRINRKALTVAVLTIAAGLLLAAWIKRRKRWRFPRRRREVAGAYALVLLKPLVRVSQRHRPPGAGETMRQWLQGLASVFPERSEPLAHLAEETDAVAYDGGDPRRLRQLVKSEIKAWRRKR